MELQDSRLTSPDVETSRNTTEVGKSTQVQNPTRVETNSPKRPTEQDSSVEMEARSADGLTRGYTRIPNSILMRLIGGDFTRNEVRVALLIARFTISFRREFAPLSKKVLERQSGLRGPAVLEAVAGLVSKGLVRKKKGDQYRPNMLGLILPADWNLGGYQSEKSDEPVATATLVETTVSPVVENATEGKVSKLTSFKDIKIYKTKLSSLPSTLESYFEELKPIRKRESEWKAFESLKQDFDILEIGECVELLRRRGVRDKSGIFQHCHSPMAYLTKAINQVLIEVRQKQRVLSKPVAEANPVEERNKEWEAQQAKEFGLMEQAFLLAYPTPQEQQQIIDEICPKTFLNSPPIRRLYAIRTWSKRAESQPNLIAGSAN